MDEKRIHKRTQVNHHVAYIEIDAQGQNGSVEVCRAVNVSKSGIMLESDEPVLASKLKLVTSRCGKGGIKVDVRLVYSMPYSPGKYRSGFTFEDAAEKLLAFVTEMIPTQNQENPDHHLCADPSLD